MRIAIAGGTGTVGRPTVAAAEAAGHEVLVLARSTGADLLVGDGLPEALAGCDAVIDVTSTGTLTAKAAVHFFETVTATLIAAERAAGVGHHVVLSIVGAAETDAGYYAGKAAQERAVMGSGQPWSMLRATQFHEFAAQMTARAAVLGLQLVPAMRSQPVAAAEVGAALVELAAGGPRGLDRDLAGPRVEEMPDLVRRYLRATGSRRPVLRIPFPGAMGRAMRDGGILPGPDARLGTQTFDEWLAAAKH